MKAPSKLDRVRELREEGRSQLARMAQDNVTRVTIRAHNASNNVTLPDRAFTLAELKKKVGQPKKHTSTAAKQAAYRARRKANG